MYMITGESINEAINVYASLEGAVFAASLRCENFDKETAKAEVENGEIHIAFLNAEWVLEGKSNLVMIRKIIVND